MDYIVELNTNSNVYEVSTGGTIDANTYSDIFQLSANQTNFTLTHSPIPNSVILSINGLLQDKINFNVSGTAVNITGFTPTTDDMVMFHYLY